MRFTLCGIGGLFLLSGLIVLTCIDQDDARHKFGHAGGMLCLYMPELRFIRVLLPRTSNYVLYWWATTTTYQLPFSASDPKNYL